MYPEELWSVQYSSKLCCADCLLFSKENIRTSLHLREVSFCMHPRADTRHLDAIAFFMIELNCQLVQQLPQPVRTFSMKIVEKIWTPNRFHKRVSCWPSTRWGYLLNQAPNATLLSCTRNLWNRLQSITNFPDLRAGNVKRQKEKQVTPECIPLHRACGIPWVIRKDTATIHLSPTPQRICTLLVDIPSRGWNTDMFTWCLTSNSSLQRNEAHPAFQELQGAWLQKPYAREPELFSVSLCA